MREKAQKILIIGASGFVGKEVVKAAHKASLDVFCADKNIKADRENKEIDLFDKKTIIEAFSETNPDFIINCAGVVKSKSKEAYSKNPIFTSNLLQAVIDSCIIPKKIIILGSASEYGIVEKENLPVSEEQQFSGKNPYAKSKIKETQIALRFKEKYNLPIVVARLFNPIGSNMSPDFLIPRIVKQLNDYKASSFIEIDRLDSARDYISISDIAEALITICLKDAKGPVYNIGSGKKTENKEILSMILREKGLLGRIKIIEKKERPEPKYASCAKIEKIKRDTGWRPKISLEETVREIINDYKE